MCLPQLQVAQTTTFPSSYSLGGTVDKLYRVGVTASYELCVIAASVKEAEDTAVENYDGADDPYVSVDSVTVVHYLHELPPGYEDSIPYGSKDDRTCKELFAQQAAAEQERLEEEKAAARRLAFDFGDFDPKGSPP